MPRVLPPAIAILAVLLAAVPASAASTKVDCGAYPSALQPAIDAAKPGKLLVISGACSGEFTIAKDLRLAGVSGTGARLFDPLADGTGHITLTISSGTVLLKDLTVGDTVVGSIAGDTGIQNAGSLTLKRVTVSHNEVFGIRNTGSATIQRSTVDHNRSNGGIFNQGEMTIDASTISNNEGDAWAGGIMNWASLLITRSTIAQNIASDEEGGGIDNWGTLAVFSSTITRNVSTDGGAGIAMGSLGSSATITGSIISGNDGGDCSAGVPNTSAPIGSGGYNLIGDVIEYPGGPPCDFLAQPTDLVGNSNGSSVIDPKLGAFGSNGGPTDTVPLKPSSPARDAIPISALAVDGTPLCPASGSTDQRGHARPSGSGCDIGSYEAKV